MKKIIYVTLLLLLSATKVVAYVPIVMPAMQNFTGDATISAQLLASDGTQVISGQGLSMREQIEGLSGIRIDAYLAYYKKNIPIELESIPVSIRVAGPLVLMVDIVDENGKMHHFEYDRADGQNWVKLERQGSYINVSLSVDGESWVQMASFELNMVNHAFLGAELTDVAGSLTVEADAPAAPIGGHAGNSGQIVGRSAGQFAVSNSGAATYSIPITLPEGIADMKPSVSLSYSSQTGNSTLGHGWSLNAVSSIALCSQRKSIDGQVKSVSWGNSDRFCLNGQRLILVSGDAYGSPGATYKMQIDDGSVIRQYGHAIASNDGYFKQLRKDGVVIYYGDSNNSRTSVTRITPTIPPKITYATHRWAQSKMLDSSDNAITYTYQNDADGLDLTEINYAFAQKNLSQPRAKVQFIYQGKPDITVVYVGGYKFKQTRRLKRVDVYNTNNGQQHPYRSYDLVYDETTADDTRLLSVQECANNTFADCFAPQTFTWQGRFAMHNSPLSQPVVYDYLSSGSDNEIVSEVTLDINHDGIIDRVWVELDLTQDEHIVYSALADGNGGYAVKQRVHKVPVGFEKEGLARLRVLDYLSLIHI